MKEIKSNQYLIDDSKSLAAPSSDERKIIFRLKLFEGHYQSDNFNEKIVDEKCTYAEISRLFEEIYKVTNNFAEIRLHSKVFTLLLMGIIALVAGIILNIYFEISFVSFQYKLIADLLIGLVIMLFGVCLFALVRRLKTKDKMFYDISTVLDKHYDNFKNKGLRWRLPKRCHWIELWLDYKYSSPSINTGNLKETTLMNINYKLEKNCNHEIGIVTMELNPKIGDSHVYSRISLI